MNLRLPKLTNRQRANLPEEVRGLDERKLGYVLMCIAQLKKVGGEGGLSARIMKQNLGDDYRKIVEAFGITCVNESYRKDGPNPKCKRYALFHRNIKVGGAWGRLVRVWHRASKAKAIKALKLTGDYIRGQYLDRSRRWAAKLGIAIRGVRIKDGRHIHSGTQVKSSEMPHGVVQIDQHATNPWLLNTLGTPDERQRWLDLFSEGDFYGEVCRQSGSRKGKASILKMFNCEFWKWRGDKLVEWFFREFPVMAKRFAARVKLHGASEVTKKFFQRGEGMIWSQAWRRLDELGVPCFQKHDALIVERGFQGQAMEVLREIADDAFGVQPVLKTTNF